MTNEKENIAQRGGSGALPTADDRDAEKLRQDTIVHRPPKPKVKQIAPQRLLQEQADNSHYFSDEFQPLLKKKARRATCAPAAALLS